MHKASEAIAAGASFVLLGPRDTMLTASVPVVAVCAVRTGSGKSQTTRAIAGTLRDAGKRVVAVRHPMPYGDLEAQRVQRYASLEDLDRYETTVEEREEYEPHIASGTVIYAGVDYGEILEQAQRECDVLLWDGGNNDLPFYAPDVHVVVADPLRAGHETSYHPGEANLRMADVVVINKMDSATAEQVRALTESIERANPGATVIRANSAVTVDDPGAIAGARVLVVEDGPTLTHGGMAFGAGTMAARQAGAAELVDPRPFAVGSIAATFEQYPHNGAVLPAMGYGAEQLHDLRTTIDRAECDVVVTGTPFDLTRLVATRHPVRRARYELRERGRPTLQELVAPIVRLARPLENVPTG
jgi:predicted GTPase